MSLSYVSFSFQNKISSAFFWSLYGSFCFVYYQNLICTSDFNSSFFPGNAKSGCSIIPPTLLFYISHSFVQYGNMYDANILVPLTNMHCLFGFPPLVFFLASSSIKISIIFSNVFLFTPVNLRIHQVYLFVRISYLH